VGSFGRERLEGRLMLGRSCGRLSKTTRTSFTELAKRYLRLQMPYLEQKYQQFFTLPKI